MYPDTNFSPPSLMPQSSSTPAGHWTRLDDKAFEQALVLFPEELPDRWQRIADHVGKSVPEVEEHYHVLVHDVYEIDSGRVELPSYADDDSFVPSWEAAAPSSNQISFGNGGKGKQGDAERKKGTPWSEEEHKLFLIGLNRFGKGDWRSISRNVVVTRTPTQVASHAQKYFLRQNSVTKKERKRTSIHDITTVDSNSVGLQGAPVVQQQQQQQQLPPSADQAQGGSYGGYPNYDFPSM